MRKTYNGLSEMLIKKAMLFNKLANGWIIILAILLSGCTITYDQYGYDPRELEDISWDKAEFMEEFKKHAKKSYESGLRGANCSTKKSGFFDRFDKKLEKSLNDMLYMAVESERAFGVGKIFINSDDQSSSITLKGQYEEILSRLENISVNLDDESSTNAYAFFGPGIDPEITIDKGLIQALCEVTKPSMSLDELIISTQGSADQLSDHIESGHVRGFELLSEVANLQQQLIFQDHENKQSNLNYSHALFFVVSHELSHILFDSSQEKSLTELEYQEFINLFDTEPAESNQEQILSFTKEIRADLYAIFLEEFVFQRRQTEEKKKNDFERTFHVDFTADELLLLAGPPGYKQLLYSIYEDANLKHGDSSHFPVDMRIKYFEEYYSALAKNDGQ